jgi:mannose-1-phosphate guanylyltransferase/mannose-1-phosphate guanylyltransferase/phosphomannomutase
MRAMVMAAGLGTRLRPITYEIPKPVVPVCNRPIVEQLARLLAKHGADEVIANLHWFPDTVKARLGDGSELGIQVSYEFEEKLLGTAGGVRNVRGFLTEPGEDFFVLAGDALTDADLTKLMAAHKANGGVATLGVKKVSDVSQYGVIVVDGDGRVQGFQEKPDPAEALSDLVNCMVYAFSPEVFDYFPGEPGDEIDFAMDVFPRLLELDVPFYVHEIESYWNDVGTLREYVQGNLDALTGAVRVEPLGDLVEGETTLDGGAEVTGPVLIGPGAEIGAGATLKGPTIIGANAKVGSGARLAEAVVLGGAEVPPNAVIARGLFGDASVIAESA